MSTTSMKYGVILILLSSCLVAIGQLLWKIYYGNYVLITLGFFIYAIGAFLMTLSYKYGDVSVLQPMMSFAYVLSLFLGYFVVNEVVNIQKIAGILFILIGIILLTQKHLKS